MDEKKLMNWLTQPMSQDDIETWFRANNIIPEYLELFRDFCFSFYILVSETYLGDSHGDSKETMIGVSQTDNENHFDWCWDKVIFNFSMEGIDFKFEENDKEYFKSFFFEIYYDPKNKDVRSGIYEFFEQIFNHKRPMTKSDLEMLTDLYKTLERSLKQNA
jgi:hypothetical protein